MPTDADRRWLTTAIITTLVIVVACLLPWIVISGGMLESGNAFGTTTTVGAQLPNWLVIAYCVVVTVFAVLQYKGIAERRTVMPVLLSALAFVHSAAFLLVSLLGHQTKPTYDDQEGGLNGAISRALAEQFAQSPITARPGFGVLLASVLTGFLLLSAVRYYKSAPKSDISADHLEPVGS